MTLPPENSTHQLKEKPSVSRVMVQATPVSPRGRDENEEDELHPTGSFMPSTSVGIENDGLCDLISARAWWSRTMWRAGIIEGIASGSLNFISGLLVATLSTWPRAVVPIGILFGNTAIVTSLISSTVSASGGHINTLVTIATTLSGLCHPVRAIIYSFCQIAGGALGGTLLRVALGENFAREIHNAGCWIDPAGEVGIWQAALIEFTCVFILLFLAYGVGLEPRQAKIFGLKYGPVLVGLAVGIMTSLTATMHVGYTGAGMFPGRCFGLAVGIGEFQKSHWVWWAPDILATVVHGLLYMKIPSRTNTYPRAGGMGVREV